MTTPLFDLAPDEWRVSKPRVVVVDEFEPCEQDCDDDATVVVTWTPREKDFGQGRVCLGHAPDLIAVAVEDADGDSTVHVEHLVLRHAHAA